MSTIYQTKAEALATEQRIRDIATANEQKIRDIATSGYLGIATTNTTPPATGAYWYRVTEAGTYTNFLSGGNPIVVSAGDLDVVSGVANNRVILEVNNGVATKMIERVDAVTKELQKLPYEKGIPFSASVKTWNVDKWLIDAYLDIEFETGFRYAFSVINKTNLIASLYKHVEGQPAAGNITLLHVFTFVKISGSKFYKGTTTTSPNSYVIADFDILNGTSFTNMYYTDGVGLSPKIFKNGSTRPVVVQGLGTSETNPVSQKTISDELLKKLDKDVTSYKHPNGDSEYVGDSNYGNGNLGVGNYIAPQGKQILVKRIFTKMYKSNGGVVNVSVRKGTSFQTDPANSTLVEAFVFDGTFNKNENDFQEIVLTNTLTLEANEYLYVFAESVSGYVSMKRWSVDNASRNKLLFKYSGGWTVGSSTYNAVPLLTYSGYSIDEVIAEQKTIKNQVSALQLITETAPEIILPDTIHAVVGDTLQLFYRGMIKAKNPYHYNIVINCAIGRNFPRYYELFSPTVGQVGTYPFTVTLKNNANDIVATKTVNLKVAAAGTSPATMKTILGLGDSLTSAFVWGIEAHRRLTGTGGSPAGRGLTNIQFKGRQTNGTVGWEGNGGWSWSDYATAGRPAYRFQVSGVTIPPVVGNTYTNNGVTFTVAEVNITGSTGNIRMTYTSGTPTASGTLTRTSGSGDATITFSSYTSESANPFWVNGELNFTNYVNTYMGGAVDVVYVLLSWNGQTAYRTDFSADLAYATTLFNHMKAAFPDIKIKLMGVQLPSQNGGMGMNYGATGGYSDTYGMTVTALNMNKAYQEFANKVEFSSFVEFVNVSAQFDSENNMPENDAPVNTRNAKTEKRGTNGVHPAPEGYYQIADVVYRNIVATVIQ